MALMRKAQRRKAKARVAIAGPAGGGKTYSALLMGYGICGDWEKICIIDTESGSGDLYANHSKDGITIGEYNIITIDPPYTPEKYMAALRECEEAGIEVAIVDSFSHAWAGEGGLLDKKGQIEKKTGNGWTAWRDVTPLHNQLVESILHSKCHVIATMRSKMDYVQEKNADGKTIVKKVGMNPVQREGAEFEFTIFMDIDQDHHATATKDRTSLFDGLMFRPTVDTGKKLKAWLDSGVDAPEQEYRPQPQPEPELPQPVQRQTTSTEPASPAQIKFYRSLCSKHHMDPEQIANEAFAVEKPEQLTKAQASAIIDRLSKLPTTNAAAGR